MQIAALANIEMPSPGQSVRRGTSNTQPTSATAPPRIAYPAARTLTARVTRCEESTEVGVICCIWSSRIPAPLYSIILPPKHLRDIATEATLVRSPQREQGFFCGRIAAE